MECRKSVHFCLRCPTIVDFDKGANLVVALKYSCQKRFSRRESGHSHDPKSEVLYLCERYNVRIGGVVRSLWCFGNTAEHRAPEEKEENE